MNNLDNFYNNNIKEAFRLPESNLPEPNDNIIVKKKAPLLIRIVSIALLIVLILLVVFACLHPVDQVKIKFFLFRNCTIEAKAGWDFWPQTVNKSLVYIDGNLIKSGFKYLEIGEDVIYEYVKNYQGQWSKRVMPDSDSLMKDAILTSELFKSSNYERVKEKILTWKIKDGVDTGDFDFITISLTTGAFVMKGYYQGVPIYITIKKFGLTKIEKPWEQ